MYTVLYVSVSLKNPKNLMEEKMFMPCFLLKKITNAYKKKRSWNLTKLKIKVSKQVYEHITVLFSTQIATLHKLAITILCGTIPCKSCSYIYCFACLIPRCWSCCETSCTNTVMNKMSCTSLCLRKLRQNTLGKIK